jgi:hypothetical protein
MKSITTPTAAMISFGLMWNGLRDDVPELFIIDLLLGKQSLPVP